LIIIKCDRNQGEDLLEVIWKLLCLRMEERPATKSDSRLVPSSSSQTWRKTTVVFAVVQSKLEE
jgi:hypothetical protein